MKLKIFTILIFCFAVNNISAQVPWPIINASSTKVDIKEDKYAVRKDTWNIVPAEKLDVYTTKAKKVTFYTDKESISFKIDPKVGEYNFIILVNGKDTARTQIKYNAEAPQRNLPAYLDTLRKARKYNFSDQREIPQFTYQAMDNSNLMRVRKELKIDSIAGSGDELSKVFNLLHWVHNLVKHDGSSRNPAMQNAIELIKTCKSENRGVNCRMLATILNECYLAIGIASRHVTCMPKETSFDDCHVINMVYIKDLKKWIWIDPTFNAYVMDEKGGLLGIQDVRERLISRKPLVLNADANWNRTSLQTKEYYLQTYMAKNLYRLEAPIASEYDSETSIKGKEITYVELLPLNAIVQSPQRAETVYKSGVKFINYKTNNPNLFWAKPN